MDNFTFLILALCALMILAGIIIAVIGFMIKAGSSAYSALQQKEKTPQRYGTCAKCGKPDVVYLVTDKKNCHCNDELCQNCYQRAINHAPNM